MNSMINTAQWQPTTGATPLHAERLLNTAHTQSAKGSPELKEAFQGFVGETFFQMMLKSMRSMHDKPAYLHGGQTEEIFQSQLDQEMASDLAKNSGATFSDGLYELFLLQFRPSKSSGNSNGNATTSS